MPAGRSAWGLRGRLVCGSLDVRGGDSVITLSSEAQAPSFSFGTVRTLRESMADPITLVYKTVPTSHSGSPDGAQPGIPIHVDVYLPNSHSNDAPTSGGNDAGVPAVVYFHGGGLVVGDRKSWFPEWLRGEFCFQSVRSIYLHG